MTFVSKLDTRQRWLLTIRFDAPAKAYDSSKWLPVRAVSENRRGRASPTLERFGRSAPRRSPDALARHAWGGCRVKTIASGQRHGLSSAYTAGRVPQPAQSDARPRPATSDHPDRARSGGRHLAVVESDFSASIDLTFNRNLVLFNCTGAAKESN